VDTSVVLLLGLVVLLYLNFSARRRSQRRRAEMDQRLVPGAEVVTTSGLHGSVDEVDDDGTVLLEIAPGWVTRWDKAAVGRILDTSAEALGEEADETTEPTTEPGVEAGVGPDVERRVEPGAEPGAAPSPNPTAEPAVRPLPDTAPPDRA